MPEVSQTLSPTGIRGGRGKWDMATGKGGNLKEKLRKSAGQGISMPEAAQKPRDCSVDAKSITKTMGLYSLHAKNTDIRNNGYGIRDRVWIRDKG